MTKQSILELNSSVINIKIGMYNNKCMLPSDANYGVDYLFKSLRERSFTDNSIIVADLKDASALDNLAYCKNKLICINNCDELLDGYLRKHIASDTDNHYLLSGRDNTGLAIGPYSLGVINQQNSSLFIEYPFVEGNRKLINQLIGEDDALSDSCFDFTFIKTLFSRLQAWLSMHTDKSMIGNKRL